MSFRTSAVFALLAYSRTFRDDGRDAGRRNVVQVFFRHAPLPIFSLQISSFLARPRERRLPREVMRLHDILERGGSIRRAQQSAAALAEAAAQEFHSTAFAGVPASPDLDWLRSCVDFLVQRDA